MWKLLVFVVPVVLGQVFVPRSSPFVIDTFSTTVVDISLSGNGSAGFQVEVANKDVVLGEERDLYFAVVSASDPSAVTQAQVLASGVFSQSTPSRVNSQTTIVYDGIDGVANVTQTGHLNVGGLQAVAGVAPAALQDAGDAFAYTLTRSDGAIVVGINVYNTTSSDPSLSFTASTTPIVGALYVVPFTSFTGIIPSTFGALEVTMGNSPGTPVDFGVDFLQFIPLCNAVTTLIGTNLSFTLNIANAQDVGSGTPSTLSVTNVSFWLNSTVCPGFTIDSSSFIVNGTLQSTPSVRFDAGTMVAGDVLTASVTVTLPAGLNPDLFKQCSFVVESDQCSPRYTQLCGDGVVQSPESCDNQGTEQDGCSSICTIPRCGDSIVQTLGISYTAEQCDDGNSIDNDNCTNNCTVPICGDGILQGIEQCDDGNVLQTDNCTNNCTLPRCGDGVLTVAPYSDEVCDDGNTVNDDACSNVCRPAECGDNIKQTSEDCDTTNRVICTANCTTPRCGDNIQSPGEECDDGDNDSDDDCLGNCVISRCGDGFFNTKGPNRTEECEDSNLLDTDNCTSDCIIARCGDSKTQTTRGEQCDDGNSLPNDACNNCTTTSCGDGMLQDLRGEICDEGSANSDTGTCTTACLRPRCGDGIIQTAIGEQCDDGGASDRCDINCRNCPIPALDSFCCCSRTLGSAGEEPLPRQAVYTSKEYSMPNVELDPIIHAKHLFSLAKQRAM